MATIVSKTKFKARALEYFRGVEETGEEVIITDRGRQVLRLIRYVPDPVKELEALRGTVLSYEDPFEPVGMEDWETAR